MKGKAMSNATKQAALPFPTTINMLVFKDDGNWGNYPAWFLRKHGQIEDLLVTRITLGHYEGSDEPAYTHESWCRKSAQLVMDYPGCVFVYGSNV